jgi:hypothetical protein
MSKWVENIENLKAKLKLGPWDDIPKSHYQELAAMCGSAEIEEIKNRLANLEKEKKDIPEWDGDSHDDIWKASIFFKEILKIKGEGVE